MHIKPGLLIAHKSLARHLDPPMDYYRPTVQRKQMKRRMSNKHQALTRYENQQMG